MLLFCNSLFPLVLLVLFMFVSNVQGINSIIKTVAGSGSYGSDNNAVIAINAKFDYPSGITVDNVGNIYLSDIINNQVVKVDMICGYAIVIAGTGSKGDTENIIATSTKLNNPFGLAVDSSYNVYICDRGSNKIKFIDFTSSYLTTIVGTGQGGFYGDGGHAVHCQLYFPHDIVLDEDTNSMYIADTENCRIRVIDTTTNIINTIAGNGSATYGGDTLMH